MAMAKNILMGMLPVVAGVLVATYVINKTPVSKFVK